MSHSNRATTALLVAVLLAGGLDEQVAVAQTTGIREVTASPHSLIPLQTRLRYTTMVVLPDGEEILDVICGDKDFWVITRDAQHRPCEAGQRGRRDQSQPCGGQRHRVLLPAHREERGRHAGPQGVRHR